MFVGMWKDSGDDCTMNDAFHSLEIFICRLTESYDANSASSFGALT